MLLVPCAGAVSARRSGYACNLKLSPNRNGKQSTFVPAAQTEHLGRRDRACAYDFAMHRVHEEDMFGCSGTLVSIGYLGMVQGEAFAESEVMPSRLGIMVSRCGNRQLS